MRRVAIAGVGATPRNRAYMRNADWRSFKEYVADAGYEAIANAGKGVNPRDIQYIVVNYHGEGTVEAGGIGPVISDVLGMHPAGVTVLSANCTGAGVSMHEAWGLVASGRYDRVLVIGFDKRWDLENFGDKRAIGGDVDYDFNLGFDHPHLQSLLQAMDYHKYGKRKVLEALVTYRLQTYWWGNRNPKSALYGVPCPYQSKEEMLELLGENIDHIPPEFWSRMPGRNSVEGASAMLLVPADSAKVYTDEPIYLDGIAYKSNPHLLSSQMFYPVPELQRFDMADFPACRLAVAEAYKMAGVTAADIDFAEAYESHISSLVPTLEATQVPGEGKGVQFIIDGGTAYDGRLPTGTDGGRGGFGLTSGSNVADGVYEAVMQMRGRAGERQIHKADTAVIIGMQGEMASSVAVVLRRP